jgi:signal transduction histidine kinase
VEEVAGRWKLDVDLDVTGDLLTVPRQTITIALVVIHEALTNAAKHTGSSARVRVDATRSFLRVVVTDEGPGLGENARRFGMRMMERRVNEAGGHLDVRSNPEGTSVAATFPIGDPR